jgi:hypothetical protein
MTLEQQIDELNVSTHSTHCCLPHRVHSLQSRTCLWLAASCRNAMLRSSLTVRTCLSALVGWNVRALSLKAALQHTPVWQSCFRCADASFALPCCCYLLLSRGAAGQPEGQAGGGGHD